jgi:hypothetical protein
LDRTRRSLAQGILDVGIDARSGSNWKDGRLLGAHESRVAIINRLSPFARSWILIFEDWRRPFDILRVRLV